MDTRPGHGWRRQRRQTTALLMLGALCAVLAGAGCGTPAAPPRYSAKHGLIAEIDAETGEITVEVKPLPIERPSAEAVHWIVNKHSEIYDSGRLVAIDALRIGDEVEFIGYAEPDSRPVRYVLTLARVSRDAKELLSPELPASGG